MATNRYIKRGMVMVLVGIIASVCAVGSYSQTTLPEEAVDSAEWWDEAVDSVALTDEEIDSLENMPIELEDGSGSEELDSIALARYDIREQTDGRLEIYDVEKDTVVASDMDWLAFSHTFIAPDSSTYCYFRYEKGFMYGLIGIDMQNDHKVTIGNYNPELVTSIDSCTTIDTAITKVCREALLQGMKTTDGLYGQIAIVDLPVGHLKAWVALRRNGDEIDDGEILWTRAAGTRLMLPINVVCNMLDYGISPDETVNTGNGTYKLPNGTTLRDPSCKTGGYGKITYLEGMKKNSDIAMYKALEKFSCDPLSDWATLDTICEDMNAMELAAVMSSIYSRTGDIYIPTLIGDSLEIQHKEGQNPSYSQYEREIMAGLNQDGGAQASFAPKGVSIAGIYSAVDKLKTRIDGAVSQAAFGGCFPADNPRFGIGVFIDKSSQNAISSRQLSSVVNSLVKALNKM